MHKGLIIIEGMLTVTLIVCFAEGFNAPSKSVSLVVHFHTYLMEWYMAVASRGYLVFYLVVDIEGSFTFTTIEFSN